jgi:hypothetical protein
MLQKNIIGKIKNKKMKKQDKDIGITKIYLVTNCYDDPNKVYIGKTKNNRKSSHKKTFGKNIIYNEIDKINSLNKQDWEPLETYWIEQFKVWGFEVLNENKGGGGPITHSIESRQKISKHKKGKKLPKEHCTKISESKKGCDVWSKGKTFSKEHCHKISQNSKGKSKSSSSYIKNKNNIKPIIQYDLMGNFIKEWTSASEAALFYSRSPESIRHCCNNKCKTSNGFIWKNKNN